jgi:MerR family transcriptional regulator, thiopeptide resistance regulator
MERTRWRVGDLAGMTGLTVRTLHHYEAVGLLPAAARTESGHRLYDEASVQRLYRICVLRHLGVPLAGIRRALGDEASVVAVLQQHLAQLERQVDELTRLRDRLRGLCRRPTAGPDAAELLRTIEAMSRLERHLDARRTSGASAPVPSNTPRWRALARELRACLEAGEAPSTRRAGLLARKARELIQRFAGGDPALLEALGRLRTADPPEDLAGWDPPLMAYLDRALRALDAKEDAPAGRTAGTRVGTRTPRPRLGAPRPLHRPGGAAGDGHRRAAAALARGPRRRPRGRRTTSLR